MNVIIMVSDGYPKNYSANNSKGEFLARGLKCAGAKVSILDNLFGTKGIKEVQNGISDSGITYQLHPRKGKYRAFLYNIPNVWRFMKCQKEKGAVNHIILRKMQYPFLWLIIIMAKLHGYTTSVLFHEWNRGFQLHGMRRFEAYFCDDTFGYFVDLIFPIGHFLLEKSKHFNKPTMLLPILSSYERKVDINIPKTHFTFCGHAGYLLRNTIVLEAFNLLLDEKCADDISLELILVGNSNNFKEVEAKILKYNFKGKVRIHQQLPQKDLYQIYDSSIGLLIPLDPSSLQDTARFSQKVAEYVASKRPIITSSVGEIPFYFVHRENAMIVEYDAYAYFQCMKELIMNPNLADSVGQKGYEIGCQYFDYKKKGKEVFKIISQLK